MKQLAKIAVLAGALSGVHGGAVWADAQEDAAAFILRSMPDDVFKIQFESMRPLIHDSVIGMMARSNIAPNDEVAELVVDLYLEEFQREFATQVRQEMLGVYTAVFSPDELEELREFSETGIGKKYFDSQTLLSRMGQAVGMQIGMQVGRTANNMFHDRLRQGELDDILSSEEKAALLSFWF